MYGSMNNSAFRMLGSKSKFSPQTTPQSNLNEANDLRRKLGSLMVKNLATSRGYTGNMLNRFTSDSQITKNIMDSISPDLSLDDLYRMYDEEMEKSVNLAKGDNMSVGTGVPRKERRLGSRFNSRSF